MSDANYWARRTRSEQLADDMHGLALVYRSERVGLSNRERLLLLRACSILADALAEPEWDKEQEGNSKACRVEMHELCEACTPCDCRCHLEDLPDEDRAARAQAAERNAGGRFAKVFADALKAAA